MAPVDDPWQARLNRMRALLPLPIGSQRRSRWTWTSPATRGPRPAVARRNPARSTGPDRASRMTRWPWSSQACCSGMETSRIRQLSSAWQVRAAGVTDVLPGPGPSGSWGRWCRRTC